jgi:hypothetical protein
LRTRFREPLLDALSYGGAGISEAPAGGRSERRQARAGAVLFVSKAENSPYATTFTSQTITTTPT